MVKERNLLLAIGSNLGDLEANVQKAMIEIEKRIGHIVAQSSFIRTTPEGFVSDNAFLNGAVRVETTLSPQEVLVQIKQIESEMGRKLRSSRMLPYTDRCIDIDIIFYGQQVVKSETLLIPHPHYAERSFVLSPLREIVPDFIAPGTTKSIGEFAQKVLGRVSL